MATFSTAQDYTCNPRIREPGSAATLISAPCAITNMRAMSLPNADAAVLPPLRQDRRGSPCSASLRWRRRAPMRRPRPVHREAASASRTTTSSSSRRAWPRLCAGRSKRCARDCRSRRRSRPRASRPTSSSFAPTQAPAARWCRQSTWIGHATVLVQARRQQRPDRPDLLRARVAAHLRRPEACTAARRSRSPICRTSTPCVDLAQPLRPSRRGERARAARTTRRPAAVHRAAGHQGVDRASPASTTSSSSTGGSRIASARSRS